MKNPPSDLDSGRQFGQAGIAPNNWRVQVTGAALLSAGASGCAALTWLAMRSYPPEGASLPFVGLFAALFIVYLLGLCWLRARSANAHKSATLILVVSVALRFMLLPGPPLLDDDIYRYRWDGKVLAHGRNPYAYAPEAGQLADLRTGDPLYDKIGFRDIPTVYPPVSQAMFAAGYAIAPNGIWGIKLLVILCDCGAVLALMGLLRALGRPVDAAAIYAWNPLVLKEFANSGHHDAAGIALLILALWALAARRPALAATGLALASMIKPVVVLLAPSLWAKLRVRDWFYWGALMAAAYLPFAGIGFERLFAGMALYARHWEMNDSGFALIQAAFGGPVASTRAGFLFETNPGARIAALCIWSAAALWMVYDVVREQRGLSLSFGPIEGGPIRTMWRIAVLLSVVLAVTPTLDPWYVCWLIPFLCLFSWRSGLMLTGTVALSYVYYWQGHDLLWLRPAEYAPVCLTLVLELARSRRKSFNSRKGR